MELNFNKSNTTDKIRFTEYEVDTEAKPMKINIIETQEDKDDANRAINAYENHLKEITEKGIKIKEEEDAKLREKLEELNNVEITKRTPEEMARRDTILRVRTIALSELNLNPLIHTSDLTEKQHRQMIKSCDNILKTMTEEEIISKFNEVVIDEIFNSKSDYTQYAIYQY